MISMQTRSGSPRLFALIQVLLLIGLALLQTFILVSGDSWLYLAPRMVPFLVFSTAAFVILALHGLWDLSGRKSTPGCDCGCGQDRSPGAKIAILILFGLVLGAGFFLPHQVLDSRVAEKKGISLQRQPVAPLFGSQPELDAFRNNRLFFEDIPWDRAQSVDTAFDAGQEQEQLREELGIWYDQELYTNMAEELLDREFLEISGETFLDAMLIISAYLEDFTGKGVDFSGFAFHDQTMQDNELAVARIAVTCCLADATVYGLLVRAPSLPLPDNDVWVRVRGRISRDEFMGEAIPMILADSLEIVPAPDQPYVYPRLYSRYVLNPGTN